MAAMDQQHRRANGFHSINAWRYCAAMWMGGLLTMWPAGDAFADTLPDFKVAATALRQATVTIRVTDAGALEEVPDNLEGENQEAEKELFARRVTVCSGVSVGERLVVTFVRSQQPEKIRITAPGGAQAEAEIRVIDHYSGLTLLQVEGVTLQPLTFAEDPPAVGSWVLSAAGWGMESAVVSFGMVSASDRAIPGVSFPPLLQCDVRTAETSSGGGIVNPKGELLGVVVAAAEKETGGWTYAAPVRHVQRLLRARQPGKVVVLKRRRPVVGMILAPGEEPNTVVVERVATGGPAEKAGIAEGDRIIAADDLNIRNVYQAVGPLMRKQPGDTMSFLVEDDRGRRGVQVTLGGGAELPAGPKFVGSIGLVDQRVAVARTAGGDFDLRFARGVRNLSADQTEVGGATDAERILLLETAVDRYGALLNLYKEELVRRDGQQAETNEELHRLRKELDTLRKQLDASQR